MHALLQDLRYAARQLRKTPGLTLLAIFTLALGVGANAAIFTVIESVILRPLPYTHSNRLVSIGPPADKPSFTSTSWLNYVDIRTQSKLLADAAGYSEDITVLENRDGSQSLVAPHVTTNLFSMLGAKPLLGRTFTSEDGLSGGPAVVLLSENLWHETFHGDPSIVGQAVKIAGIPRTVVGVMPNAFRFPESIGPDLQKGVWLPLQPTAEMLKDRGYDFFNVIGLLRADVSTAQAQRELEATRVSVARLILRQGSILIGAGLGVGLMISGLGGRLVKGFLYQVQPLDVLTYAAVVLMLSSIGLVAALLPARKAATLQPMEALRED